MRSRYVWVLAALVAACSSATGSNGASGGGAGSYDVFFQPTMTAASNNGSATLPQALGTISLGTPAGDGSFSGAFSIKDNASGGTRIHPLLDIAP